MTSQTYENHPHELQSRSVKYLCLDIERRKGIEEDYKPISLSIRGLSRELDSTLIGSYYFTDCLEVSSLMGTIELQGFSSRLSLMSMTLKKEWVVEILFNSLHYGSDGNIQLVGHNLIHDQSILENLFHECGYPFYWDDTSFPNGDRGVFEHIGFDTLQMGMLKKISGQKKGLHQKVTLEETSKMFDIQVSENLLHNSEYDCWLCEQIFLRSYEMIEMVS